MTFNVVRILCATLVGAATSSAAVAQQVPLKDLPKPSQELEDPFSLVSFSTELRGGRVVVSDAGDGQLFVVDFTKGTRTALGRQGSGPGEYRVPGGVFRIAGDTLWILDAAQMRIAAFRPDLTPGTTFPFLLFDQKSSSSLSGPFFVDARGRVYATTIPIKAAQSGSGATLQLPDTAALIRIDARNKDNRSEMARVRLRSTGRPEVQRAGNDIKYKMAFPGLIASDPWAVFPDGRLAIVRGSTYTVEYIGADGTRSAPVTIPYERIKVTEADRSAEIADAKREMGDQQKAMQKMMPANMSLTFEITPPEKWPNEYPPVGGYAAIAAPDGRLWVKRAIPVRLGREQWDVIDPKGKLVARYQLPPKVNLIAAGEGVVYTVRIDEDDLRYLQRVPIPK